MKFVLAGLVLMISALQATEDLKDLDLEGFVDLAQNIIQFRPNDVLESDVRLYLYTRENPLEGGRLHLHSEEIDSSKPTKFIIHGYMESHDVSWYMNLTREILKYEDVNVVQVDWRRVARTFYISSAQNTKLIGIILGTFIVDSKLRLKYVHMIGHSLGAHIAGFAAKEIIQRTDDRIGRITGLDPAGPFFTNSFVASSARLYREDAKIVDVIHTDGGFYGYYPPIGTLDIYVNGGRRMQPGCADNELEPAALGVMFASTFCSHTRSYNYFTQSINNVDIECHKCKSLEHMQQNRCSSRRKIIIRHQNVTDDMQGICLAKTGSQEPYFVSF